LRQKYEKREEKKGTNVKEKEAGKIKGKVKFDG
jgi:hypothetical protein